MQGFPNFKVAVGTLKGPGPPPPNAITFLMITERQTTLPCTKHQASLCNLFLKKFMF